MKHHRMPLGAVAMTAFFCVGCRTPEPFDAAQRLEAARVVIAGWPEFSRFTAARAIERYGSPDAIAQDALGWKEKGPWKRIVVWNATDHYVAEQGTSDDFEQTVAYRVPADKLKALEEFSPKVRVSPDATELSSRSSDESLNCLTLNLADEIVRGARDPAQARRFYDGAVELASSGKSSRYMQRLLFASQ